MQKTAVALVVFLLLLSAFVGVSERVNAQSSGVIRIKADGTVTGTDKIRQNEAVYTLTGDLYASIGKDEAFIFIEKEDITFNGAGYTVQGTGVGSAIYMLRSQNVIVEDFVIRGFSRGIDFGLVKNLPSDADYLIQPLALGNEIHDNVIEVSQSLDNDNIRDAGWCIYLNDAVQTVIKDNKFICHNPLGGVYLGNSTKETSLLYNDFAGGGIYSLKSDRTNAKGNTIDGKPLIYLDSEQDKIIENAGLVYLFNCKNIMIKNIDPIYVYAVTIQLVNTDESEISNSNGHILLVNSNYNSIHDNKLSSIALDASSYNQVFANTITQFNICIKLYGKASFNKIYGNLLLDTIYSQAAKTTLKEGTTTAAIQIGDIELGGAFNNEIQSNMIVNHDCGVDLFLSTNNTITANTIKNCTVGIRFGKAHENTITENNLTFCKYAISIYAGSSYNSFNYNNFIDNIESCVEIHHQTNFFPDSETYSTGNIWDNGKTGNYWDKYTGKDENNDGIGDTPYQVYENMTDHYPLMKPFENSPNTNIPIPTYDPAANRPTPSETPGTQFNQETKIIIIALCITLAVISAVLIYFRRLIFR